MSDGTVITFYSYKGGTGRSMAVANVACLLGALVKGGGEKVLAIDWDLEAPGLHRYLETREESSSRDMPGLIDYFAEIVRRLEDDPGFNEAIGRQDGWRVLDRAVPLSRYCRPEVAPGVDLLRAGRLDREYKAQIASFDWVDLYESYPSVFEAFHELLSENYRYTLIDSRTGLTDTSGICTAVLPEKLVAVFTPNVQSVEGLVDVIDETVAFRRGSDDIRPLGIYPLPCRVEASEDVLRDQWRRRYQERLQETLRRAYRDESLDLTQYFDEVQVAHKSDYAYGEKVAVRQPQRDALSMSRYFEVFCDHLVSLDHAGDDPAKIKRKASAGLVEALPSSIRWRPILSVAAVVLITALSVFSVWQIRRAARAVSSREGALRALDQAIVKHREAAGGLDAAVMRLDDLEKERDRFTQELTAKQLEIDDLRVRADEIARKAYAEKIARLEGELGSTEDQLLMERKRSRETARIGAQLEQQMVEQQERLRGLEEQLKTAEATMQRDTLARKDAERTVRELEDRLEREVAAVARSMALGKEAVDLAQAPESQLESLRKGIRAVGLEFLRGREPPEEAMAGLRAAVKSRRSYFPLPGHAEPAIGAVFSEDGDSLLTIDANRAVRGWDVRTGRQLIDETATDGELLAAVPVDDGFLVVTADRNGRAIVSIVDRAKVAEVTRLERSKAPPTCAAVSRGRDWLAVGYRDGTCQVLSLPGGNLSKPIDLDHAVEHVEFGMGSVWLLTVSGQKVRVWERNGEKRYEKLESYRAESTLTAAGFFGSLPRVYVVPKEGQPVLWSPKLDGSRQLPIRRVHGMLSSTRDRGTVAAPHTDLTAGVWRIAGIDKSRGIIRPDLTLSGHEGTVNSAAISADGTLVVTTSDDRTARVWDARTGNEVRALVGHRAAVRFAAIDSRSRRVVTLGIGTTARLWDLEAPQDAISTLSVRELLSAAVRMADGVPGLEKDLIDNLRQRLLESSGLKEGR